MIEHLIYVLKISKSHKLISTLSSNITVNHSSIVRYPRKSSTIIFLRRWNRSTKSIMPPNNVHQHTHAKMRIGTNQLEMVSLWSYNYTKSNVLLWSGDSTSDCYNQTGNSSYTCTCYNILHLSDVLSWDTFSLCFKSMNCQLYKPCVCN